MNTHGSIGPSCAVAEFKDGRLTVWTPSQASHLLRVQLATMLALQARERALHLCRGRGLLRPQRRRRLLVRGGLDRHADRPAGAAAVDARGRARLGPEGPADLARLPGDASTTPGASPPGRPTSSARAADEALGRDAARPPRWRSCRATARRTPAIYNPGLGIPYALAHSKLTAHWLLDTPLPAAWIRAPGRMQNTFGNESFLDEIAAATGVDPFEIRVRHLDDPRGLELHRAAAAASRSGSRAAATPARRGRARARARRLVRQVRTGAHLRRRRRRRGRSTGRSGAIKVERVFGGARLRPDHQPRRPAQPDRGQRRADGEPHAGRESSRSAAARSPASTGAAIRS